MQNRNDVDFVVVGGGSGGDVGATEQTMSIGVRNSLDYHGRFGGCVGYRHPTRHNNTRIVHTNSFNQWQSESRYLVPSHYRLFERNCLRRPLRLRPPTTRPLGGGLSSLSISLFGNVALQPTSSSIIDRCPLTLAL